jgi:T4 RnlA family RNA ligase
MNIKELNQLIADGYINVNKHPNADLYIYNYSQKTQYERVWNDWTLACRGLIMDKDYNIVARPFQKFFNLEELNLTPSPSPAKRGVFDEIFTPLSAGEGLGVRFSPNESFEVYEKMDGSLGVLYWIDNQCFIATRGSFVSEQAQVATEILHSQYAEVIPLLDKSKTYLFEIIYPENRIVLDYGNERKLVLLAIIDTQTGIEVETFHETPSHKHFFPIVKRYDGLNDLSKLKELEEENKEGFVVKFKDGHRLKVKFDEYQRLHRIVTQISNQDIWEFLKDDKDFAPLLDRVPDEFYDWVKDTKAQLLGKYSEIEAEAKEDFKVLENRKETALYFLKCKYPAVLFKILDGQNYDEVIWKMIKPDYQKPFADKST